MTDNKLPSKVVRQLGPDVWTFTGFEVPEMDIGTRWIVVSDTPKASTVVTHIAADAMDAYDKTIGQSYTHPLPYPDEPYHLPDVESEAWHTVKYLPDNQNIEQIEIYQLVGIYHRTDEVEYQKGVDDGRFTPIKELGLVKRKE
tara:strand:- start:727 stop:1155 length:429 start_codon:yes stop_codon:yes gene_type:complete